MPPDQADLSDEKADQLVGRYGLGRAALVENLCLRRDPGAKAEAGGAQVEVGILAIHEEGLVEPAEAVPVGPADHQQAAADDVRCPLSIPLPAAVGLGIGKFGGGQEAREAEHSAEGREELDPASAGTGVEPAVRENRPPAPDPRLGHPAGKGEEPVERAFGRRGVRVEQQKDRRPRPGHGDAVGMCEAAVFSLGDQSRARKGSGDGGCGPVSGGIVVHDQLDRRARPGQHRAKARQCHRPCVVAQHDDGNLRLEQSHHVHTNNIMPAFWSQNPAQNQP